jgi:hypothetical protein
MNPTPLSPDLVERVLEQFGLSEHPRPDLAGLCKLYSARCRNVPFDNIRKLIASREPQDVPTPPPPGSRTAAEHRA